MKKAILYIRVSTDEQAERGYSLKDQEARLRKYCEINSIEIVASFFEDFSAKTFNRPEFKKMLEKHKRNKERVNYLLFIRWDRFSRNTTEAYAMISTFKKIGIEPQAVEQPLDLSIPENKMMLAFYLAIPEVENDRRSLNVTQGMRRAKKEGRWMSTAPIGYNNVTRPDGSKRIVPSEDAPLVKWAFEQYSKGRFHVDELRQLSNKKGLKCSKSMFYILLRNPAYYGKIFIPEYNGERALLVKGIHEPLIPVALFEKVQLMLSGKKIVKTSYETQHSEFPLRGFLVCSRCGKKLTGSASVGRSGIKYYYYHCQMGCKERIKADTVNFAFSDCLKEIKFSDYVVQQFRIIYRQVHNLKVYGKTQDVSVLQSRIHKDKDRLAEAQRLMLDRQISVADYQEIRSNYCASIQSTETELNDLDDHLEITIRLACKTIRSLDTLFIRVSIDEKR